MSRSAVSLSDAIDRVEHLAQTLDRHIDGVAIGAALRYRSAGGCLDVTLGHHKAPLSQGPRRNTGRGRRDGRGGLTARRPGQLRKAR